MVDAQGLRDLKNRHNGWIPPPLLKPTQIVLSEPGSLRELLLRKATLKTQPPHVRTHEPSHVHATVRAICDPQAYTLQYISGVRHDPVMLTNDSHDDALELLDELILEGRLDQKEQEALRLTTVLQICAHAASRPELKAEDHKLLALLLARWGFAVTDRETWSVSELQDAYPLTLGSLRRVLRWRPEALEEGLRRLTAAQLIGLTPTTDSADEDAYAINFLPALTELGPTLIEILYREFLEREGYELRGTAEFYLDSIGADIEELCELRPADPRVRILLSDYRAFASRMAVAELMRKWLEKPKAIYAWLANLAEFEERCAILSGSADTGLQRELAERATKKILILARNLEPPPTTADAA